MEHKAKREDFADEKSTNPAVFLQLVQATVEIQRVKISEGERDLYFYLMTLY